MNKEINLRKYEGHTEGPWKAEEHLHLFDLNHLWRVRPLPMRQLEGSCYFKNEADAQLIADAPLLLAEVKRLQKYEQEHKELWDIIANFSPRDDEDANDTYQEWLDSVSQGYMGSVYEYIMMKQEEMIE